MLSTITSPGNSAVFNQSDGWWILLGNLIPRGGAGSVLRVSSIKLYLNVRWVFCCSPGSRIMLPYICGVLPRVRGNIKPAGEDLWSCQLSSFRVKFLHGRFSPCTGFLHRCTVSCKCQTYTTLSQISRTIKSSYSLQTVLCLLDDCSGLIHSFTGVLPASLENKFASG